MNKEIKKYGFTLIELLAVIAILAILIIFLVPNVIKLYNKAQRDSFVVQAKSIYKTAQEQYMSDQLKNNNVLKYCYDGEVSESKLSLSGGKKVYYKVAFENDKIIAFEASSNEYSVTLTTDINQNKITEGVKNKEEEGYNAVKCRAKVYGVTFDLTKSDDYAERTDAAIGMTFSNPTTNNIITSDFDTAEIYKEMIEVEEDGNTFIKIPKFYIKKTANTNRTEWTYQISKEKKDSEYYLPACFMDEATNTEMPYILVGKYNASLSSDGTKLESKTNSLPLVKKNINEFRTLAKANGEGYQLLDIHTIDALQTLFYIEFASLDSQSIMSGFTSGVSDQDYAIVSVDLANKKITMNAGVGSNFAVGQMIDVASAWGSRNRATNLRIAAINEDTITYEVIPGISVEKVGSTSISAGHYVYNVSYLTGTTDELNNKSGSAVSNTDGKYAMSYRGIENLYGNLWQYIDGVNIKNYQAYVARDAKEYASDLYDGIKYKSVDYTNATTEGYVSRMGYDEDNPFIQLPTAKGSGKYGDYYYLSATGTVVHFSGSWSNTPNHSGLTYWRLNHTSSSNDIDRSARIVKTPL